jgi:hypothetical protein
MTVVERWKGEEERPRRWKHECDQSTLHVCMKITKKQLKTITKRSEWISSTYNIPMCENATMKPLCTVNVHWKRDHCYLFLSHITVSVPIQIRTLLCSTTTKACSTVLTGLRKGLEERLWFSVPSIQCTGVYITQQEYVDYILMWFFHTALYLNTRILLLFNFHYGFINLEIFLFTLRIVSQCNFSEFYLRWVRFNENTL